MEPRGYSTPPVKLGQQPKRVLRGVRATGAAKRRQRVLKPCDRASKVPIAGVFALVPARTAPPRRNGLMRLARPGSESTAKAHWGSPGTWEILSSPREYPGGRYRVTNSRPASGALVLRGSETHERTVATSSRRKRSGRGTGGRKSQHPRSTDEAGEADPLRPGGGKEKPSGGAWLRNRRRETCWRLRTSRTCSRNADG